MPASEKTILILGGTAEAAALAAHLSDKGLHVVTSLAGRTREPAPIKGKTRIGGFGGPEGLASYIRDNGITLLVDMTHPFATQISSNARKAAELSGVRLIAWQRPAWARLEGDNWLEVENLATAVAAIPPDARVLLALGSQHIAPFAVRNDVHFLVRMVDEPATPLSLPDHELLIAKPGPVEDEFSLLRARKITHIVCRNSGGKASYTKIAAARLLALQVIIVKRHTDEADAPSSDEIEKQILAALG